MDVDYFAQQLKRVLSRVFGNSAEFQNQTLPSIRTPLESADATPEEILGISMEALKPNEQLEFARLVEKLLISMPSREQIVARRKKERRFK